MKKLKQHILVLMPLLLLTACHNDPPVIVPNTSKKHNLNENMINANRTIAQAEETAIDAFVTRRGWTMSKTPDGARVWVYVEGNGTPIAYEDSVHVQYTVEAINGTVLYKELKESYVAGRRQEMIGLDEALLGLHRGSKAKVILPSRLAYGIGGDGDRIPQSTILVLDVTVL